MQRTVKVDNYTYQVNIEGHGHPNWVFLHGFLGSSGEFRKIQPEGTRIYVNLLGFGQMAEVVEPAERFRAEAQVNDLIKLFETLYLTQFNLVGYSMGARLALAYALAQPDSVTQLWLESGTAGISDREQRQLRQRKDVNQAVSILTKGLGPFVDQWEALPLFATQQRANQNDRSFIRTQRMQQLPENVANSLRFFGTGMMPDYTRDLRQLEMPVGLITGSEDQKFYELAQEMHRSLAHAQHFSIEQTGHNVHFEQPKVYTDLLNQGLS